MKEKLKISVKEKPIFATVLIAIIIGLSCLVIYLLNYCQPQTELPPKLKLITKSGEEIELLLVSYDWTYKGQNKTYDAGITDLTKYDFSGKNTIIDDMEDVLDVNDKTIITFPKYNAQGFIQKSLYYQDNEYSMTGSNQFIIDRGHKFNFVANASAPNIITVELNSAKQGKATYAIKYTSCFGLDIDKIKASKNLEFNQNEISTFLQNMNFGQYLKSVEIKDKEINIVYEYYIQENILNMLAEGMFALIDEAEKINFDFAYNKYTKTDNNKQIEFNKVETITYDRENFISSMGMSIEEFSKYINK